MNISKIKNCYGCGVCAIACPRKIIDIKMNLHGFYEPSISEVSKCIDCGICMEVCSFCHDDISLSQDFLRSYAGWSNSPGIRRICSSGGIGFEIGRSLLMQGYKVGAVRYDVNLERAEHFVADSYEELIDSIGSKYIQSYTVKGFQSVNRKGKYLITGTPCQIDSFRRYIRRYHCEDNFVLMDFFCHGVPSMLMWKKYLHSIEKSIGKVNFVSWRNKTTGWHDSWAMAMNSENVHLNEVPWQDSYNLLIKEKKGCYNSRYSQGDAFYRLFLGNLCLGKQCYKKCKFKANQSSADIRIGDCWGNYYMHIDEGVSSVIAFTKKGDEILMGLNCTLEKQPFSVVVEGQMCHNPHRPILSYLVMFCLENNIGSIKVLDILATLQIQKNKLTRRVLNPKRTMKKFLKRLLK